MANVNVIEVLIEVGSNTGYFPRFVPRRIISRGYPYNRIGEVVTLIKEAGRQNIMRIEDYREGMFEGENEGKVFMFAHDQTTFYTYDSTSGKVISYVVKQIVTDGRPWTIYTTPRYGERIHKFTELEDYRVVDEELNYGYKVD